MYESSQISNDYLMGLTDMHYYQFISPGFATHEGLEIPCIFMKRTSLTFGNAEIENKTAAAIEFKPVDTAFAKLLSECDPFTMEEEASGMARNATNLNSWVSL